MRLVSLIAYDAEGNVVATLDHLVVRDESGMVTGLVDFGAQEDGGGRLREVWEVSSATGSGTWPEWLGPRAADFRVELTDKRITALVHKTSGHRRDRAEIEAVIEATEPNERGERDIRHLVGGPNRPLLLDEEGRTTERPGRQPNRLPVIGRL